MWSYLRYILAFTLTASVAFAMHTTGWGSFAALAYAFGFIPLLEILLPPKANNASEEERERWQQSGWFDAILLLTVPAQAAALYWLVITSAGRHRSAGLPFLGGAYLGLRGFVGCSGHQCRP